MGVAGPAAEKTAAELIAIGDPPKAAELISVLPDGELQFRDAAGGTSSLRTATLVRWSTPVAPTAPDEILLVDGSRIRLAAAWGKESSFIVGAEAGTVRTHRLGEMNLPRTQVRAAFWKLPPDGVERQKRIDALLASQAKSPDSDVVLLDNGDMLTGTLASAGESGNPLDDESGDAVATFIGPLGEVELPATRIRGIAFSPANSLPTGKTTEVKPTLWVGLQDGSLIAANSIAGSEQGITLHSDILGERRISIDELASLQADGAQVAYLSDLDSTGYRHEPYLDLRWAHTRDRNVLGDVPTVGERPYLKTIGMHSASRLTFDLDGEHDRFAASVAVDDAAEGRGSVVFRVFLNDGGQWREAYASGVVRGGEAPKEVAVEVKGAEQLALVVDYANRGDECDYANWLDARLETTAK